METDKDFVEDSEMEDYEFDDNEEDLAAVSLHDEVVIFNRSDGTWYSRTYDTLEIAKVVYDIESKRL